MFDISHEFPVPGCIAHREYLTIGIFSVPGAGDICVPQCPFLLLKFPGMISKNLSCSLLAIGTACCFYACRKDKKPEQPVGPPVPVVIQFMAEKNHVKTFELISLKGKRPVGERYNAVLGTVPVVLIRTGDSTLSFVVPDVANGEHMLQVDSTSIKFTVAKTAEINTDQLTAGIAKELDSYLLAFKPATASDTLHMESIVAYKTQLFNQYNALTAEEKRVMGLYNEANQALFKGFEDGLGKNRGGKVGLRLISECDKTNFKAYGICVAEALHPLVQNLNEGLKYALIAIDSKEYKASPALAIYLRLANRNNIVFFRNLVKDYLEMTWIFRDELFDNIETVYPDEVFIDLKINAGFRTLDPVKDKSLDPWITELIREMEDLKRKWAQLPLMGAFPAYQHKLQPVELKSEEWKITDISNNKVIVADKDGEKVKFNATSNQVESFAYWISATKQGFNTAAKKVNAEVRYINRLLGTWTATMISHGSRDVLAGYRTSEQVFNCSKKKESYVKFDKFTLTFKGDDTFDNYQGYAPGSFVDWVGTGYICNIETRDLFPRSFLNKPYDYKKLEQGTLFIPITHTNGRDFYSTSLRVTLIDENTLSLTANDYYTYILKRG